MICHRIGQMQLLRIEKSWLEINDAVGDVCTMHFSLTELPRCPLDARALDSKLAMNNTGVKPANNFSGMTIRLPFL